jgi:hypothetical protein
LSTISDDLSLRAAAKKICWREVLDSAVWDRALLELGGHPLQSALWGDARRAADGIEDRRVMASEDGKPWLMARMELRPVPVLHGFVGWIPRGPAGAAIDRDLIAGLTEAAHFRPLLVVTDRWCEFPAIERSDTKSPRRPETIWIDLAAGKDTIWKRLDKQWRYGVGKAHRAGVSVAQSRTEDDKARFIGLNREISDRKGFGVSLSRTALDYLLAADACGSVSAHLFVARTEGAFAAAALILKCGSTVHYISGGTDRRFSKQRVGEALQWSIIEWAIVEGARLYDLEGIDRKRNPGTFAFKKKMGGCEVVLRGKEYFALSRSGVVAATFDRLRDRFAVAIR